MSPLNTRTCWAKQGIATAMEVAIKTAFSIRETPLLSRISCAHQLKYDLVCSYSSVTTRQVQTLDQDQEPQSPCGGARAITGLSVPAPARGWLRRSRSLLARGWERPRAIPHCECGKSA